jgi:phosphoribosylglycinamide formyltransferase-1
VTGKRRIGALISGRGSNLQALIDAAREGRLGGEIAVVISNVESAPGLERTRAACIPAVFRDHRGRSREDFDSELLEILNRHHVDLVCLAGFMRLLSAPLVRAFAGRLVNVHPSLLPAFPGTNAQRQALEHGVKVTGATVHMVDEGLDSGPIVMQEAVPVLDTDDVESLSARILVAEHRIYPRAVLALLGGRHRLDGRRLVFEGVAT